MSKITSWEKANVFCTIFALIVAALGIGITAYQSNYAMQEASRQSDAANKLSQQSLELANMTSNFEPELILYNVGASVNSIYSNVTLDSFGRLSDYGSLNVSLVVITPHASIVNFTDTSFSVKVRQAIESDDFLDSSNFFGTDIFLMPYLPYGFSGNSFSFYWPEAFVQAGFTQLNFAIPIFAYLALNSSFTGSILGGNLGTVTAQVTMYDVQTKQYVAAYNLSTQIYVNVNWNYG